MNIIYNKFMQAYISNKIILEGDGAPQFKIALLTEGFYANALSKDDFSRVQLQGFEVPSSVNGKDTGYVRGGKSLTFQRNVSTSLDSSVVYYRPNPSVFEWRTTGSDYADIEVCSALIYVDDPLSEYNGMLVTWIDLGSAYSLKDDQALKLRWNNILTFDLATKPVVSYSVDSELSSTSTNPVQNKVLTELIKRLGVFTNSELDSLLDKNNENGITDLIEDSTEESFKTTVDTIGKVSDGAINSIFTE